MISIIIPTFKEESTIEKTVRQFASLTIPHEVIVSDGRSPDRTAEIARTCADTVLVFRGEHHNASIGRDDGAKVAHGEFLAFIDSGVAIRNPDAFFKSALKQFEANSQLTGLAVAEYIEPEVETTTDRVMLFLINTFLQCMNNVFQSGAGSGKCMLVRRSAFERVGGFRPDLPAGEDTDMMRRLSKIGRTRFDHHLIIYYSGRREHEIGWPRLLSLWMMNALSVLLFDKSVSKEWKAIR